MKNFKKGFTLIELLVVVAIIGILAAVVLASLGSARSRGSDAAVKSNLLDIRSLAELKYDNFGCYANSGVCNATTPSVFSSASGCPTTSVADPRLFFDSKIVSQIASAKSAGGGGFTACSASVGGKAWATAVQLKSDPSQAWCVDYTGASKRIVNGAAGVAYTQATLITDITGSVCGT